MRVQLRGAVRVYPTEDCEKVRKALENLFPLAKVELVEGGLFQTLTFQGEGIESLSRVQALLRQERIRDAVRRFLHERVEGDRIKFYLNKQVAYVGRFSLCEPSGESPLGPIEVELESDDLRRLIDWLSPASTNEYE
ncbi:MAG: RNA-binding domain-containing protein [Candidatus Bathyarchaeia archaeon]